MFQFYASEYLFEWAYMVWEKNFTDKSILKVSYIRQRKISIILKLGRTVLQTFSGFWVEIFSFFFFSRSKNCSLTKFYLIIWFMFINNIYFYINNLHWEQLFRANTAAVLDIVSKRTKQPPNLIFSYLSFCFCHTFFDTKRTIQPIISGPP